MSPSIIATSTMTMKSNAIPETVDKANDEDDNEDDKKHHKQQINEKKQEKGKCLCVHCAILMMIKNPHPTLTLQQKCAPTGRHSHGAT